MPWGGEVGLQEFVSQSDEYLRGLMRNYLNQNPELDPLTKKIIVIDIEGVVHGNKWGELYADDLNGNFDQVEFEDVIEALIKRVKITREFFPNALLAYYGVVQPNKHGYDIENFRQRMKGYKRAGELGLYDLLNYLSPWLPIIYSRDNPGGGYDLQDEGTRQAIENSELLTKSNGEKIPIAPITTFVIINQSDPYHQFPVHEVALEAAQIQLDFLSSRPSVHTILFWIGNAPENYNEIIPDYFSIMKVVPKSCFCGIENQAPLVEAGADQVIHWPANQVILNGIVRDDGLPTPPGDLSTQWVQISGPNSVYFENSDSPIKTVQFPEQGTYKLRLVGNDKSLTISDDIQIDVLDAGALDDSFRGNSMTGFFPCSDLKEDRLEPLICYQLSDEINSVKLDIYSKDGKKIKTLFNSDQARGTHDFRWDGKNETGKRVSSGVYSVVLEVNGHYYKSKLILIK
jgi:hypothetical protein